jgi:mono/diheme cytochrome c family protein
MRKAAHAAVLLSCIVQTAVAQSIATPLTRFAERKAEALLRDVLSCLGCHQLDGDGGRIAPDLSSARQRRSPDYIASMIADPQRTIPGTPMPRIPMPEPVRELITRYVASRPQASTIPAAFRVMPRLPEGAARDGKTLYANYCASCHGASGRGDGPNAPYLPVKPATHASRAAMSMRSDDALFDTIAGGGAIMNRSQRMPPFGATLSPTDIHLLVRYIRELCRCRGPSWSTDGSSPARAGPPS